MTINSYSIGDYFKLNHHRLLMVIGGYSIMDIGGYFRLNYHRAIVGY